MNEIREKNWKDGKISRRSFLLKVWVGLCVVAFFEIVGVVLSFLKPHTSASLSKSAEAVVTAGKVDEFEPNTVTPFPQGHFYLVRLDDGGFLAFSRRCTHLGCTVPWVAEEKRFVCPCHSSVFDIHGSVIQSPAPRALDLFTVKIENDVVRVDTGRPVRRSGFRKEQAAYSKNA